MVTGDDDDDGVELPPMDLRVEHQHDALRSTDPHSLSAPLRHDRRLGAHCARKLLQSRVCSSLLLSLVLINTRSVWAALSRSLHRCARPSRPARV